VEGVLLEKRFEVDDVIKVGETVAVIELNGEAPADETPVEETVAEEEAIPEAASTLEQQVQAAQETVTAPVADYNKSERFYSPLVKNIAKKEGISLEELDSLQGSGKEGRVTKNDILEYIAGRKGAPASVQASVVDSPSKVSAPEPVTVKAPAQEVSRVQVSGEDEIIPLSRMGKLIAQHMTESVSTSAHVQSFIEVDVTNLVAWRNKFKGIFQEREGEKLTFTPIFMEAVAKALKTHPLMNISVKGDSVIKKKNINIGMATALPDGNLIVPVIKNADQLNLVGMARVVNDLAVRSRNNALKPDEIQGGTYTVTNVGTFGSVFGTPIINQPQVGILALGAIRKVPAVIETSEGDFIGIRSKMFLSHSYDHRVVNGALGSSFIKTVADYLEAWDTDRDI
ncbi:MAG: 2-oxo acid dehydrogenase subunit E2, partial [Eudoraea sp.]|nr:2-oxo acid dehydrogenase subunit E2 [Eudoraea sp.]NNK30823.1 2-oxo acid dehydrogenase subunit E2 [Flavobacteriaceae bacterium]